MMSTKTFMLTCPIITALWIALIIAMPACALPYFGFQIDPIVFSNSLMVMMFFVVPCVGAVAKIHIHNKYTAYIPESKDWVYKFKREIDNLEFVPKSKKVSWSEIESAVPRKYTESHRVYATLLLIDGLRGKIPSKGVPPEAKDFVDKHYDVYIGLLLH